QSEVPVVDSGAMEEPPIGGTFLTQSGRTKGTGIEEEASAGTLFLAHIEFVDGREEVGRIHGKGNGATEAGAQERLVVVFNHGDGKAGGKAGDAADLPAIGEALGAAEFVDRQIVGIAEDKVMRGIERRERPTEARVDRIDLFAVAGRIVNGLTEGVAKQ